MNIQSNINQALSIAGFLASQTPMASTAREKYMEKQKVKEAYKSLENSTRMAEEGSNIIDFAVASKAKAVKEKTGKEPTLDTKIKWAEGEAIGQGFIAEKMQKAAERVFEADPTEKNYERFVREATGPKEIQKEANQSIARFEEEKALIAQEKEQRRLARSAILEGIYTGSAPRTEKDTERITTARGGY